MIQEDVKKDVKDPHTPILIDPAEFLFHYATEIYVTMGDSHLGSIYMRSMSPKIMACLAVSMRGDDQLVKDSDNPTEEEKASIDDSVTSRFKAIQDEAKRMLEERLIKKGWIRGGE